MKKVKKLLQKVIDPCPIKDIIHLEVIKVSNVYNIQLTFIIEEYQYEKMRMVSIVVNNVHTTLKFKKIKSLLTTKIVTKCHE